MRTKDVRKKMILLCAGLILYQMASRGGIPLVSNALNGSWRYGAAAIFCILAVLVHKLPKTKKKTSLKQLPGAQVFAAFTGVLYILTYFAMGVVNGYGENPFDTSFLGIVSNIFLFMSFVVLIELLRDQVINGLGKKHFKWVILVVAVGYACADIHWSQLAGIDTMKVERLTELIATNVVPAFLKNYFMGVVVLYCGPWTAIFIQACYQLPLFIFPVIPNHAWVTIAMLNALFPLFSTLSLEQSVTLAEGRVRRVRTAEESVGSWILTSALSIAIVWFAVGVFPVFPTVVLTGSMQPVFYPGDVSIVRKVKSESELAKGDVIQYWTGEFFVIHRIIDITPDHRYITKGDNNNGPDPKPVGITQVKGKVIERVPYIGQPVVMIRSLNQLENDRVGQKIELGRKKP